MFIPALAIWEQTDTVKTTAVYDQILGMKAHMHETIML